MYGLQPTDPYKLKVPMQLHANVKQAIGGFAHSPTMLCIHLVYFIIVVGLGRRIGTL